MSSLRFSASQPPPLPRRRRAFCATTNPVELSPFVVSDNRDDGYKATNALSGTRYNTSLLDLPKPVDVTLRARLTRDGAVLAVPRTIPSADSPAGPASASASAAVEKLQHLGFFAPAEASVSAWRNAARPGASSEAARSVALLLAAAQRFDRRADRLDSALAALAAKGAQIDAAHWTAHQAPEATARGEAVAALLIQLAGVFP